jgi:glycosyltransferase involved in cell wall biosynthesis
MLKADQQGRKRSLRVAWFGEVGDGANVGMVSLLLDGILRHGCQVDYYCMVEEVPKWLLQYDNLSVISTPPDWSWDRWYSRAHFAAFVSGLVARTKAYNRACEKVLHRHSADPYDCVFQFSQTELFKLGRNLDKLPPIVIHPCTHAAGELYWHRRESAYALQSEKWWMHYITRLILTYRAGVQKREMRKPTLIIGPSHRFNALVSADYNVLPTRQRVLYHLAPPPTEETIRVADKAAANRSVIKLLMVSRISVRKGVQYIVELSHRLDNLAGQIQLDVAGDRTQWSDYLAHMKELNPRTARYLGQLDYKDVLAAYEAADILLVPSVYEPGPIVTSEALARGVCVVTSDAVGAGEVITGDCHRSFTSGDIDQFEHQVRQMIADVKTRRSELRQLAREQYQKHFTPDKIAQDLVRILEEVTIDPLKPTIAPETVAPTMPLK